MGRECIPQRVMPSRARCKAERKMISRRVAAIRKGSNLPFFYNENVVERVATILHEARHADGAGITAMMARTNARPDRTAATRASRMAARESAHPAGAGQQDIRRCGCGGSLWMPIALPAPLSARPSHETR